MEGGVSAAEELKLLKLRLQVAEKEKEVKQNKPSPAAKAKPGPKSKEKALAVDGDVGGEGGGKAKRAAPVIVWSEAKNTPLTGMFLTLIEESNPWRQAFGFSKGDPGHGANSQYRKHHDQLKDTGHGLVMSGHESDITSVSEIANVWDKIKVTFPWYKHMGDLLGSSPIHSRTAITHSTSVLNLSALEAKTSSEPAGIIGRGASQSPSFDDDEEDNAPTPPPSHDFDASSDVTPLSPTKDKPTPALPKVEPDSKVIPQKRKAPTMGEQITAALEVSHDTQIETMHTKISARKDIEVMRLASQENVENRCLESVENMETKRLKFQSDEAARNRQHDLMMIAQQIELERIKHGLPGQGLDPTLFR
ncbi:hypothetical protein BDN72DRAFT_905547 [Pluteus cervinus]|uniref:Uncharacterized protein n=1 Tax=Pluteus cervinus TaxID=181527 RepID=A0ACD3A239_9AGAR|nr:hypothetical protein BDN72DRAFT_905547 [Pluteus cervinus]